jgi:hypothetical protein
MHSRFTPATELQWIAGHFSQISFRGKKGGGPTSRSEFWCPSSSSRCLPGSTRPSDLLPRNHHRSDAPGLSALSCGRRRCDHVCCRRLLLTRCARTKDSAQRQALYSDWFAFRALSAEVVLICFPAHGATAIQRPSRGCAVARTRCIGIVFQSEPTYMSEKSLKARHA